MNANDDAQDEFSSIRQELLASFKRSYRIFLHNSYMEALGVPLYYIFLIILAVTSSAPLDMWIVLIVALLFLPFSWGRSVKKRFSFLHWSRPLMHEIATSEDVSHVLGGIISYINQMFRSTLGPSFQPYNLRDVPPSELLEKYQHQQEFTLFLLIFITAIYVFFLWVYQPAQLAKFGFSGTFFFWIYITLAVFLVVDLVDQAFWVKSIKRWVFYYEAHDRWGRELEGAFTLHTLNDDGGS